MEKHPKLYETLSMPLCGETRVAICYVHLSKSKQFEKYINKKIKYCCDLYRSEDMIKNNWFGLFKSNPKLWERVGDYVLVMKDNYLIKDKILGDNSKIMIGNHGGLSREEMLVPLIVIEK